MSLTCKATENLRFFLDQIPIPCLSWRHWQELVCNWTLDKQGTPILEIQKTYGIYELPTIEATHFLAGLIDYIGRKIVFHPNRLNIHSAGCGRALYEYHINTALAKFQNSFSIACSDTHATWFLGQEQFYPFVSDIKEYSYSQAIATKPGLLLLFWIPPWKGSLQPEGGQPEILDSISKYPPPNVLIVSEKIGHSSISEEFHEAMTTMGYQAKVFTPRFMSTIDFKPLPKGLLLSEGFIMKKLSGFSIDTNVVKDLLEENWDRLPDYANSSKIILYLYFQKELELEDFRCPSEYLFDPEIKEVEPPNKGLMELCSVFEMLHVR